jgi:hypothetical protein
MTVADVKGRKIEEVVVTRHSAEEPPVAAEQSLG